MAVNRYGILGDSGWDFEVGLGQPCLKRNPPSLSKAKKISPPCGIKNPPFLFPEEKIPPYSGPPRSPSENPKWWV